MYKVIHKLTLSLDGAVQTRYFDHPVKILSAQEQDGNICVWYEVDENQNFNTIKNFFIIGTGKYFLMPNGHYVNTIQLNGFVWHIYVNDGE